jgi:ABC-2 type transport system permease protein
MYPSGTLGAIVFLGLLGSGLAAGGGVLVSLRAATARQAQQTVGIALMVVTFGNGFGVRALPEAWQKTFIGYFTGPSLLKTELTIAAALLVIDLLLIAAARARFQRARLVLD